MSTVNDIYKAIDGIAPFKTADKTDNAGFMAGDGSAAVKRALIALDVTGEVIDEALELGANLIITHHPVIFNPLRSVSADMPVYRLIRHGISCISAHTNLDKAKGGVNDCLAGLLGLEKLEPFGDVTEHCYQKITVFVPETHIEQVRLAIASAGAGTLGNYSECAFVSKGTGMFRPLDGAHPAIGKAGKLESVEELKLEVICERALTGDAVKAMLKAHPYETPAYDIFDDSACHTYSAIGRAGLTDKAYKPADFATLVKRRLACKGLRYIAGNHTINKVAVCGGSGGGYLAKAAEIGADAYVTADVKYDVMLSAGRLGITLIDAGHFATENVVSEPLRKTLSKITGDVDFVVSKRHCDGWDYMI